MPLIFYNNESLVTDYVDTDSVQITKNIDGKSSANFKISKDGKDAFLFGTELKVFDGDTQLFGGIFGPKVKNYTETLAIKDLSVSADGYKSIPARIPVQVQFDSSGYCGEILKAVIAAYLQSDGITEGTIQNGGLASEIKPSWQYCSALFDSLASASSFNWWINYNKTLDFKRQYLRITSNLILGSSEDPEKVSIDAWDIRMTEGTRDFKTRVAYSGGGIYTQAIDEVLETEMSGRYGSGIYGKIVSSSALKNQDDALTTATNELEDCSKSANKIQFKTSSPIDIGYLIDVNIDGVTGQYHVQSLSISMHKQKVVYDVTVIELDGASSSWGDAINNNIANATADTIQDGKKLYGITIGAANGLTIQREDGASDAIFNSDKFTMRALDDEGNLADAIYFDTESRKYKITGQVDIENVVKQDNYSADMAVLQASLAIKGGQNVVLNSSGRGGTTSWETTGTITAYQDDDAKENTSAKSYFKLENALISQTFNLTIGKQYMLSFLYKKNACVSYIKLNDVYILNSSTEQADWTKILYPFIPTATECTIEIYSDSSYLNVADIMLAEGNNEVWAQAPDEIYTSGMKFDSNGLLITQTGAETKFIADASGTRVIDTTNNNVVASYGKTKMYVKEIQCEGQISAGKLRIIPVSGEKAFRIVINN